MSMTPPPPAAIALRREPGPLARSLTALLLRLGLGMMFLMAGLSKFDAIRAGQYPAMVTAQFEDNRFKSTIMRPALVKAFADALPYAEVGLGAALIAGLLTTLAATLTGVLLLHLFFGHLVLNRIEMYPAMFTYLLVDAAILWLSPVTSNYLSLDGLLFGWFWAPRAEGEYRREGDEVEVAGRRRGGR